MRAVVCAVLLATAMPIGSALDAQQRPDFLFGEPRVALTLFGGYAQPGANGDLWAFTFDELTLGRADLGSLERGGDFAVRASPRLDVVVGYAKSDARRRSEMRDWVDEDGAPIRQTTRFIRRPLSLSLRYHLRDRGRSLGTYAWVPTPFVPFASLGVGRMSYRMDQAGEFVASGTNAIFTDRYRAEGRASFLQAGLGAAWSVRPSLLLTAEARYLRASADGDPSFAGFNELDLSGLSTSLGLTLRLK
jgi:hypothetical protein